MKLLIDMIQRQKHNHSRKAIPYILTFLYEEKTEEEITLAAQSSKCAKYSIPNRRLESVWQEKPAYVIKTKSGILGKWFDEANWIFYYEKCP